MVKKEESLQHKIKRENKAKALEEKHKKRQEKRENRKRTKYTSTALQRRSYNLKHKYNLTVEEYNMLYTLQHGACAICGVKEDKLYIDHDHNTALVQSCHIPCGESRMEKFSVPSAVPSHCSAEFVALQRYCTSAIALITAGASGAVACCAAHRDTIAAKPTYDTRYASSLLKSSLTDRFLYRSKSATVAALAASGASSYNTSAITFSIFFPHELPLRSISPKKPNSRLTER